MCLASFTYIVLLRFNHVVACINNLFLYIAYLYLYSIAWMYQNVFIHSPDNGFLGCFRSWMIMKAAVSMYVQVIFVNGYPSLLALFYWNDYLFSTDLSCHHFKKSTAFIPVGLFLDLYSLSLVYVYPYTNATHCLDYRRFIPSHEIK